MEAPVFILGLHRSGTTLLYQMLARSGCFNILTARHVICYDEIARSRNGSDSTRERLQQRFHQLGMSRRDVDDVLVHPDTPEEYGFLLDNLHAGRSITRRHLAVFHGICETVQRDQTAGRTLLLKNPWDFGNARQIRSLIPDARFIFIHRNPLHALSSMFRLIESAIVRPSLYMAELSKRYRSFVGGGFPLRLAQTICRRRPRLVVGAIILHAARQARGYLQTQAELDTASVNVRFESLCEHPTEAVEGILEFLGLTGERTDYRPMIGRHQSSVTPLIAARRKLIIGRLGEYAATFGYPLPRLLDGEAVAAAGA